MMLVFVLLEANLSTSTSKNPRRSPDVDNAKTNLGVFSLPDPWNDPGYVAGRKLSNVCMEVLCATSVLKKG